MPARTKFDHEFEQYLSSTAKTKEICLIQSEALRQIAVAEVSVDGGLKMKAIAEKALLESATITKREEVQNAA